MNSLILSISNFCHNRLTYNNITQNYPALHSLTQSPYLLPTSLNFKSHLSNPDPTQNDPISLNLTFQKSRPINKFSLAPMGFLAPGSTHARPSAQHPSTLAEIFRRTCLGGGVNFSPFQAILSTFRFFTEKNP